MSAPVYVSQRKVGTVNEIVAVYVQATTAPFLGLQNVTISSGVSACWFRSDATGASSIPIISSATMGTYSSGNWTQVNSTVAPGWYEFGVPSAALSSGRWAAVQIFSSSNAFSPAPVYIELAKFDNQTYVSSQTLSTAICRVYSDGIVTTFPGMLTVDSSTLFGRVYVTTAPGIQAVGAVGVSSFNVGLQVGVSSFDQRVGVSSFNSPVGVSSFNVGLQVGVSTFDLRVGVSSFGVAVGVSSFNTPLQVGVSSFGLPVGVSSFNAPLQVGVSSFSSRVGVSSFGIAVGVSSMQDKSDYGVSTVTGLDPALLDASVSSRLAAAGYTAPDNTGIGAIKIQTDRLTYTVANQVDVNIKSVTDITITGTGTAGNPWGP